MSKSKSVIVEKIEELFEKHSSVTTVKQVRNNKNLPLKVDSQIDHSIDQDIVFIEFFSENTDRKGVENLTKNVYRELESDYDTINNNFVIVENSGNESIELYMIL